MQRTEKAIEIDAPIERVFDLFSDFENFPRWMSNIKDVHYTGRRFTRWTARAPLGTSVEWEAETVVFEPDHRIGWRTVRGDVNTNGEVIFESTRRGTTLLRVIIGYDVPAGRLGALVASLFGRNPEQELEEDLRHFAEIAEGREQRGAPSRNNDRASRDNNRYDQSSEDYADGSANSRRDDERNQSDKRFDEALRNARRSQQEDWQKYDHEREADSQRRRRDEDAPRRQERAFGERSNEIHEEERQWREDQNRQEQNAREPETKRHALTPRERERELEMERERRLRNVPEESRKVFRRGVDRLAEEGPSTRWRRD